TEGVVVPMLVVAQFAPAMGICTTRLLSTSATSRLPLLSTAMPDGRLKALQNGVSELPTTPPVAGASYTMFAAELLTNRLPDASTANPAGPPDPGSWKRIRVWEFCDTLPLTASTSTT